MKRLLDHQIFAALRRFVFRRREAYCRAFKTPGGRLVLEDLARFCRVNESTFHQDPRVAAMLDGRREVFLRIQQHLKLSPDEVFDLLVNAQPISQMENEDIDHDDSYR